MIEWGNNWARAINYRKHNNEAFAGFFSQIGRLYNVHHIWCKSNEISLKYTIQQIFLLKLLRPNIIGESMLWETISANVNAAIVGKNPRQE